MPLSARVLGQLETLTLESKRKFIGQRHGIHRSKKRGQGLEFSDYRQYELGDNPRHIDWGIYGRSDRLYVKRFLEDQDLSVLIILDASGSMTEGSSQGKWRFARSLAEAITYVGLMAQDSIRIIVPGSKISPKFVSPKAFHGAIAYLDSLLLDGTHIRTGESLPFAFAEAASLVQFPGLAIVISDCLYSFEQFASSMSLLRSRNLEIHLVQLLSSMDIDPLPAMESATLVDRETSEEISVDLTASSREMHSQLLTDHLNKIERYCSGSQIQLVRPTIDSAAEDQIIPTLLKTGLLE